MSELYAFPQGNEWMDHEGNMRLIHEGGMTLREYYVGQAIGAVIKQCAGDTINPIGALADERITRPEYFAAMAGQIADAMLAESKSHEADRAFKEAL